MRFVTSTSKKGLAQPSQDCIPVLLFGRTDQGEIASAGAAVAERIAHERLRPEERAWDLLTIALAVVVADYGASRRESPDGWTRQLDLSIGVNDLPFWNSQKELLQDM